MRTIVITGASSGIGAQAARHLARSHPEDRLILIGRNPDRTKRVAAEVGADYFLPTIPAWQMCVGWP